MGSTQLPIQDLPGHFPECKATGALIQPLNVSSSKVKNELSYTSTTLVFLHGVNR